MRAISLAVAVSLVTPLAGTGFGQQPPGAPVTGKSDAEDKDSREHKESAYLDLLRTIDSQAVSEPTRRLTYRAAYEAGRKEADAELAAGQATIYRYGWVRITEEMDRETGLPFRTIAGCVVDDEIIGRHDGHNARITESVKARGLPRNSFKSWEKELYHLRDTFEARAKSESPHRLTLGGPAFRASDGAYSIRPVKVASRRDDGRTVDDLAVVVGVNGVEHEPLRVFWDEGETDFLWGPEGAGFAIIRSKGEGEPMYLAVDLKRGRWLRESRD
jgi:hypothetical protein